MRRLKEGLLENVEEEYVYQCRLRVIIISKVKLEMKIICWK